MNQVIDLRAFTNSVTLPILVMVDLQEEYLASSRALAIPNVDAALANCRSALTHARATGIPVAFTRWVGSTFFNPATRFSGWIEGFEPHGSDLIFRAQHNRPVTQASTSPKSWPVTTAIFIMAGFAGEAACLSTAIDAFHRGHRVIYSGMRLPVMLSRTCRRRRCMPSSAN